MIIKTLVENTSISKEFGIEHGLSLYVETKMHRLLFDTGRSGLFAENALKMDVDLSEIDIVVISHGHHDHGGGLETFLSLNNKAKIYVNKSAFEGHYADELNKDKKFIGLDRSLMNDERFIYVDKNLLIDEELELFSNIKGERLNPSGNGNLLMMSGETCIPDDFNHEQNLIISENEKMILMTGCSHNGIVNIIERFKMDKKRMPDCVIGGFHLFSPGTKKKEKPEVVFEIGDYLFDSKAKYYTGHCTGNDAYELLKSVLKENLGQLSTGNQIIF